MPVTRFLPKAIALSTGSVKMRLARSHRSPRWKMSRQPSESMNCISASRIAPPTIAERRELLLDELAALVEDAVVLERLDDQVAARDELDQRAQDVRAAALDLRPC